MQRTRVVATGLVVTGALLPVPCVAAARWLGNGVYPGLVVSWALLVPSGCLAGLILLVASHTLADFRAAALAIASIVVGLVLLPAAGRIGTEAYVSSHATNLESLAARLRAEGDAQDEPTWITLNPRSKALADKLVALGMYSPGVVDGGLLFRTDLPFADALLYADGVPGRIPLGCSNIRAIGGRWYIVSCSNGHASDD
ncbi:MAG: hypothetical protein JO306_14150 [Gemmatimonadetes bacterium]|nr:hypothetical protein [Gemmatimonadota bacterium]